MFPNQVTTLARLYTRELDECARQTRPAMQAGRASRPRGEVGTIRKNAGWTLVQIGLRIAASASR
jgi:hypothetical protein